MVKFAYGGRVLRIDLSNRSFSIEDLDEAWIRTVIGGRAANSLRLYEELETDCDPLGPDNMLIFGTGPLTGSYLPASAYFTVSARSPLTGILGDSAAGGQFGAAMKQTGFDQIIITGASQSLIYLMITDENVEFVECPELRGLNILDVTGNIRNAGRDHDIEVAAIGPAGENMVLFSSIVSSGNRVNGRTGMGAVMGSKKLKAVAVRGRRPHMVHDTIGFMEMCNRIRDAIARHPEYEKRRSLGTTMLMKDLNQLGILPTNHFQKGVCEYVDTVSGEALADTFKVKNKACFNCSLHCSRYYVWNQIEAEGPEFETLCSVTSRIGNRDLGFGLEMNNYLNQVGMDSISTSEVIGWLMECQETGLVTPDDVDGIELRWGDTDAVRKIVEMIAHRKGIGDAMADGATRFSESFSEEAQKLVMQVKGLDIICGDPRGIKAYGLTYATASRGADHLRAEPYFELSDRRKDAAKRFGTEMAADRLSEQGKAELVTWSEKMALLTDCLTMCKNIGLCMEVLDFKNAAGLLKTGCGFDYDAEEIESIMGQCIERDYAINKKFGITKEHDTLPERFLKESLPDGPTKGSTVDIKKMVDEYYRLHGR